MNTVRRRAQCKSRIELNLSNCIIIVQLSKQGRIALNYFLGFREVNCHKAFSRCTPDREMSLQDKGLDGLKDALFVVGMFALLC